jgi:hypothetical protein
LPQTRVLTRRCTRPATAGLTLLRWRVNSNVKIQNGN